MSQNCAISWKDQAPLSARRHISAGQRWGGARLERRRAKIAELINDWFYRAARDFHWDMLEPLTDGHTLYARYAFSFVSTLPEAQGRRVGFEGVSIMKLRDDLIREYREVANVGPALVALGFAPERVCKILARAGKRLRDAPEMARHLWQTSHN